MKQELYGGVELGGTKTICAVGDANGSVTSQLKIPTTSVDETLSKVFEFFEQNDPIIALNVGSFGPLQLDPSAAEFGYIYNAPKPGWTKVDLKGLLASRLKLPVAIDTDVNCSALGELYYGAAKGISNFVYITVGTGIGGGSIIDGKPMHGLLNLEMGHMRVPHEPFTETFQGACPFHGDCLEGIASGYALAQRYGRKSEAITDGEAWEREATYLASALHNIMFTLGPERIVLGGGLMAHAGLLEATRAAVRHSINGYLEFPDLENYIVKSSSDMNGVLGAMRLAASI